MTTEVSPPPPLVAGPAWLCRPVTVTPGPPFSQADLAVVWAGCPGSRHLGLLTAASADVSFARLGWDSLDLLDLIAELRRTRHIDLPDDLYPFFATTQDVVDYVNAQPVDHVDTTPTGVLR